MNAAHLIVSQPQSPLMTDTTVERQGPRELEAMTAGRLSPALLLQSRLEAALETQETARWPGYVRVPLIVGGAIVAWGFILTTALRFFH